MATINSKEIIKDLLLNNGYYSDDPQCYSIWSYRNNWGGMTQAVFYSSDYGLSFVASPHIHDPLLLWMRDCGLTVYGQEWLEALESEKAK